MKKHIFLIFALFSLLSSCQKEKVKEYDHSNGVYFQLYDNWSNKNDTVNYNFIKNEFNTHDYMLRVNLQGVPKDYDRKFSLTVNTEKSSAIEGVEYESPDRYYILPANKFYAYVPVTLKRSERLKNETLILTIQLEESDDLVQGFDDRLRAVIQFTDRLSEPYYWKDYLAMLGPYSQVKQITFENETGLEFPLTKEEFAQSQFYNRMIAASNYMNKWFAENVVYDENDKRIEPWK